MRVDRLALGRDGEARAAAHLEAAGLRLIDRNYRCRFGEIDLVAIENDATLVLVEVRLRSRADFGGAAASVDGLKQRRLVRAARHLLMTRPRLARLPARFDVIELSGGGSDGAPHALRWIRAAFST